MDLLNPREPINTWSHGLWLMIALAGIIMLWQRGHGDRAKQVSLLIYGLSLIFCSACSTLYHGVRLPGERIKAFALMDHVGIYMLIAGTYTPIAWTFLRRHWRRGVLGLVWFWAALGITIHLTYETLPLWLSTGFYLGMGWGALFCYFEVARRLSHRALIPIVAGGVLYSLGAIFNLLHGPVLWPGVFRRTSSSTCSWWPAACAIFTSCSRWWGRPSSNSQFEPLPADSPPLRSTFTAQPAPGQVGG